MKTVKMAKIPKCDICKEKPARYDAPLAVAGGSWGYVCADCAGIGISEIGSILEPYAYCPKCNSPAHMEASDSGGMECACFKCGHKFHVDIEQDNKGKKVRGKDLSTMEQIVMDGDREIECPLCGAIRMVEPDAHYTFTCEDCGAEVKVPCIM